MTADVPELFEALVAQPPRPRQLCLWLGSRVVLVYGEDGRCSRQLDRRFTALPGSQPFCRGRNVSLVQLSLHPSSMATPRSLRLAALWPGYSSLPAVLETLRSIRGSGTNPAVEQSPVV
ncbi:hypothetical protein FALBO_13646 [Fusarium albosuccineum]|uniref:Uncharacterized protein n=1 Tax=Fusarium albosuccineum TaxID=1237068 RepID=A0A8H4KZJ7_9HYPO|nr:hypothetical protein FALBO_13646 [Fusarium albosuccineum]